MTLTRGPRQHGRPVSRRAVMRGSLFGGTLALAGTLAGCASSSPSSSRSRGAGSATSGASPDTGSSSASPDASGSVLLAYFSRPGENYYYGDRIDLEVGNTEVLAGMIAKRIKCDPYRIAADDPYSADYDATVARNKREQDTDARPAIAKPLPALDGYDIVLLASPIWGSRPPMIMSTFAESLDFENITVHPVTTHAMSGLGSAERDYAEVCRGATLARGLAVQGEEVKKSGAPLDQWLRTTDLAA
jgi:flavodoxin